MDENDNKQEEGFIKETNLVSLDGKVSPIEIAQSLNWEKMQSCLLICKDEDGEYRISVSTQDPQEMLWAKTMLSKFVDSMLFE